MLHVGWSFTKGKLNVQCRHGKNRPACETFTIYFPMLLVLTDDLFEIRVCKGRRHCKYSQQTYLKKEIMIYLNSQQTVSFFHSIRDLLLIMVLYPDICCWIQRIKDPIRTIYLWIMWNVNLTVAYVIPIVGRYEKLDLSGLFCATSYGLHT